MLSCQARKIRDNTPEIKPAGKLFPRDHGIDECMVHNTGGRVTPTCVNQIRSPLRPEVGKPWTLSRRMGELPVDETVSHGKPSRSSETAAKAVCPPLLSQFQQAVVDKKEGLYLYKKDAPLGSIHDQTDSLPDQMDIVTTTFGKKVPKEESVGKTVNPPKSMEQVDKEYFEKRELYKKSHNTWDVSEIVDRNYDWSKFSKDSLYGVPTPHDNAGIQTKKAMHWLHSLDGQVIASRLDEFREKYQFQVGKVRDPLADTMNVGPEHAFGVTVFPDELSAGDLLHMEGETVFSQCLSLDEGLLTVLRNVLKKQQFHNFFYLLDALQNLDKEKSGVLPKEVIRNTFFQFEVPLSKDMLEMLMHWCSVKYDEHRDKAAYEEMILLMDWKNQVQYDRLVHTKVPMPLAGDSFISLATANTTTPNMELLKGSTPKDSMPTTPDKGSKSPKMDQIGTKERPGSLSMTPRTPKGVDERQPTSRVRKEPSESSPKSILITPKEQKTNFQESTPADERSSNTGNVSSTGQYYKLEGAGPENNTSFQPGNIIPSVVSQGLLPNYRTTSQKYRATTGTIPTNHLRSYGVPTIRSDLAAPRIKRVSDSKNYGDESNSYNLLYPSVYANHGVYEADFFEPRSKEQLQAIFQGMDIKIPEDVFDELWEAAGKRNGKVSVEGFREVIHDMQQIKSVPME